MVPLSWIVRTVVVAGRATSLGKALLLTMDVINIRQEASSSDDAVVHPVSIGDTATQQHPRLADDPRSNNDTERARIDSASDVAHAGTASGTQPASCDRSSDITPTHIDPSAPGRGQPETCPAQ